MTLLKLEDKLILWLVKFVEKKLFTYSCRRADRMFMNEEFNEACKRGVYDDISNNLAIAEIKRLIKTAEKK